MGVERAVDNILSGTTFLAQVRRRDSENGLASLELVDAKMINNASTPEL